MKKNINKKLLEEEIVRFYGIMNIPLNESISNRLNILTEHIPGLDLLTKVLKNAGKEEVVKLLSSNASKDIVSTISRKYIQQSNDWSKTIDNLTDTELLKLIDSIDFKKFAQKIIASPQGSFVNYNNRKSFYEKYVGQIISSDSKVSEFNKISDDLLKLDFFQKAAGQVGNPIYARLDKVANKIFVSDFKKYIKDEHKDLWNEIGENITTPVVADAISDNIDQWQRDLKGAGLSKMEVILLTNNIPSIRSRGLIKDWITSRAKTQEKLLSDLDDTLQYVASNVVKDLDPSKYAAEFKKINLILGNLMGGDEEIKELIYDEIQKSLNSQLNDFKKVNKIMLALKEHNVLDKNYKMFWPSFYRGTYVYNMWNPNAGIKDQEKFIKLSDRFFNALERGAMFMVTGNLRKLNEYYTSFVKENKPIVFNGKRYAGKYSVGFLKAFGWLLLVKWVFMPWFLAVLAGLFYWFKLTKNYIPKRTSQVMWDTYISQIKYKALVQSDGLAVKLGLDPGSFNWMSLIPIDVYGKELWDLLESGNMGAFNQWSQENLKKLDEKGTKFLDASKENIGLPKNTNQQTPTVTPQNTNQTPSGKKDWD